MTLAVAEALIPNKPTHQTAKEKATCHRGHTTAKLLSHTEANPEFVATLVRELNRIGSDAKLLRYLPHSTTATSESKYGPVPYGSPLSYQQKLEERDSNIINHQDHPSFPDFPLPELNCDYSTVLNKNENDIYVGLSVTPSLLIEIEQQTREQSLSKIWHDVRRDRLTSSVFKDIYVRCANHDSLSHRLLNQKNIMTAAMKHGVEHEPEAAKCYAEITGNNVYACGFVINPIHRKVFDPKLVYLRLNVPYRNHMNLAHISRNLSLQHTN